MDRQKMMGRNKTGVSLSHPNMGLGRRRVRRERGPTSPTRLSAKRTYIFCHYCGYTPQSGRGDQACPKCNRHAWESGTIAGRLIPQ